MPSHSPTRTSTLGPGRMSSRRSPGFRPRVRTSPDRRRRIPPPPSPSQTKYVSSRGGSPSRGRDRREFRNSSPRRSRSPIARPVEAKQRGFSPPKRKMSPKRDRPISLERERERERMSRSGLASRKRSRSKSPPLAVSSRDSHLSPYVSGPVGTVDISPSRYQNPTDMDIPTRRVLAERFRNTRSSSFDKDRGDRPVFRGAEGAGYDISELKKISVDIRRNLPGSSSGAIERSLNPDDLVIVRRPAKEEYTYVRKGEGSRPIFDRDEIVQARSERRKYSPAYERSRSVEDQRVVAIVGHQGSSQRYASPPPRYSDNHKSRDTYRARSREREHSSREYPHDYDRGYEREKVRDDSRYERRGGDDLRQDLEVRHHRDEPKYSSRHERSRSYERPRDYGDDRLGSDLRMRINEKKDRHDDRDGHHRVFDERERDRDRDHRDRHHMMQPSPPGSDRRRGPPMDMYSSRGSGGDKRDDSRMRHEAMPPERYYQKQPMPPPPDFSASRPDKFYKSWEPVSPDYVPKGKFYYEHDNREDGFGRGAPRGRGGMMPRGIQRGRGTMRGRPFRGGMGPNRGGGFIAHRGMTRRGGFAPRGFFNAP